MIKEAVLLILVALAVLFFMMWVFCASLEKQHDEIKREIQELKKMVGEDK
jgi:cell division protein FtsL